MRVLVTGAAGFIGSHLVERLLSRGHSVVGIDNFNAFYDPRIKERNISAALDNSSFDLVRGDILDQALLEETFSRFNPERVVHLAAWAGVRPSIQNPAIYQSVNVEGTTNILQACRHHAVDHLVFASSSSVYGNRDEIPFRETDSVSRPISPYAATKATGELLAYTWHHLFGLNVHCLRFFTVYGPRQRPEMAIAKFTKAIVENRPITLFGDGTSARDYTYIEDIIDGVEASINRVSGYEIINLGNSTPTLLSALVSKISDSLGIEPKIEYLPMQPGDVMQTFASVERAARLLDYQPKVSTSQGIRAYVDWFRGQAEP